MPKPKKHTDVVKEKYGRSIKDKDSKKKPDQPNLFGEQEQVYNVIQEEISILVAGIVSAQEAISKKEDQVKDLMERKQKLEKAALTVAKLRDAKLEKKGKKKEKKKE